MPPTPDPVPEHIRAQSLDLLNQHLAAIIDLQGQVRQALWNMRDPGLAAIQGPLHKVPKALEYYAALLAAYVVGLDSTAHGTVQVAAARSFLLPYPLGIADAQQHARAVARALWDLGRSLSEASGQATNFGSMDTAALFAIVASGIDRQFWIIESVIMFTWDELRHSWTGSRSRGDSGGATRFVPGVQNHMPMPSAGRSGNR